MEYIHGFVPTGGTRLLFPWQHITPGFDDNGRKQAINEEGIRNEASDEVSLD